MAWRAVFCPPWSLDSNFGLIPFLQAAWYSSSKEDVISTATERGANSEARW